MLNVAAAVDKTGINLCLLDEHSRKERTIVGDGSKPRRRHAAGKVEEELQQITITIRHQPMYQSSMII
jgi:hypothetical protein